MFLKILITNTILHTKQRSQKLHFLQPICSHSNYCCKTFNLINVFILISSSKVHSETKNHFWKAVVIIRNSIIHSEFNVSIYESIKGVT